MHSPFPLGSSYKSSHWYHQVPLLELLKRKSRTEETFFAYLRIAANPPALMMGMMNDWKLTGVDALWS